MTILIINICKHELHYYEFVKPIEKILEGIEIKYSTKDYDKISKNDLEKSSRIIICGTSLKDNNFLEELPLFDNILKSNKPILGICGGMEILGTLLGGSIKERKEIGTTEITFQKDFLGVNKSEEKQVYHLHNFYVDFSDIKDEVEISAYSYNIIPQAFKHKTKKIYGTLFHPEVKNKEIIINFCKE